MTEETKDIKGHLKYLTQNCVTAFSELLRLNDNLHWANDPNIETDINQIGALHRMVQDYLIVRVAGLFDPKPYTASFETEFNGNQEYEKIKKEEIIKYLIIMRHTFVGHNHKEMPKGRPQTCKILESNLPNLLDKLLKLLNI